MATKQEQIEQDIFFWQAYCELILVHAGLNDALRLLNQPIGDKGRAKRELNSLGLLR